MIYRLKELKGDTIAVPQLVFSKLALPKHTMYGWRCMFWPPA